MNNFYALWRSIFIYVFLFFSLTTFAQVGIGTTNPNGNALLELDASATPGGLLLPRVALVETNNAAPLSAHIPGMAVYNTATTPGANGVSRGYYFNDGSRWVRIAATSDASDDWKLTGNAGTDPDTNFIGTLDATNLRFRTSNAEAFEISSGDATNRGKLRAMTDGTAALPVYSWSSDTDTGIYRVGANSLGFSTNGTEKFRIPNAQQVHAMGNGTAAAPFYSWGSDSDIGMYRIENNTLGFSTNGSERIRVAQNGNVKIGTGLNATEKLEIDGNLRLNGAFMPNNIPGSNDKILLSKGAGTAPAWGPGFLNTAQITNIGKYFVGPINSTNNSFLTVTVTDPNMTSDTSIAYNFVGNLPNGIGYGYDFTLFAESRNGTVIFYITNFSEYNLTGLQIVYTAFYH